MKALHSTGIRNVFENLGSYKRLCCDLHTKQMRIKQDALLSSAPGKILWVSYVLLQNYIAVARNRKSFFISSFLPSSLSGSR